MGSVQDNKKKGSVQALKEELANLSPWIKWQAQTTPDGDKLAGKFLPIEGILVKVERVEKTYSKVPGTIPKEVFVVHLEQGGRVRQLDGTKALYATLLDAGVDDGDRIRLTKTGEMKDTRYQVEKI